MVSLLKLISNPIKIYLIWLILIVLFCVIGIPILSNNASGGEQKQLTYLAYAVEVGVYGFFFLSILTSIKVIWFKKYWYVNIPIFLITGFLIMQTI